MKSEKLNHLNPDQLTNLLNDYYDDDRRLTVQQIIDKYDVDCRTGELASFLPRVISSKTCVYCDSSVSARAPSRSSSSPVRMRCDSCGHYIDSVCYCQSCDELRKKQDRDKEDAAREKIRDAFSLDSLSPPDPSTLSLEKAVFFKSLLNHSAEETLDKVSPYLKSAVTLSPSYRLTDDLVKQLYYASLIAPDPESNLNAFSVTDQDASFYLSRVEWVLLPNLNLPERLQYIADVDRKLAEHREQTDTVSKEDALWRTIVREEALEYYGLALDRLHYGDVKVGPKTISTFDDLIERLPLSQIYQVVFKATGNSLRYITEKRLPRAHARNIFRGSIERTADKYAAQGWLKDYKRDFDCPQTTLSSVFFNNYLGIGDDYFNSLPPLAQS